MRCRPAVWLLLGMIVAASAGLAGPASGQGCSISSPTVIYGWAHKVVCTFTCTAGQTLHLTGSGVLVLLAAYCPDEPGLLCDDIAGPCAPMEKTVTHDGPGSCEIFAAQVDIFITAVRPGGIVTDFACSVT